MQKVSYHEMKMQDLNKEVQWTALPEPCQKCFGIKRKRKRTENDTSKLHCDSDQELLPKVTLMDTSMDPVLSGTSQMMTEDMSLSAVCSSGIKVSDEAVVSASLKTLCTSAAATTAISCSSNTSRNLLSIMQQTRGLNNTSKAPQTGFVRPLFRSSVSKFDSLLHVKEADSTCSTVSSTKDATGGTVNKDLDLHRCPLCDMVFDARWVRLRFCH